MKTVSRFTILGLVLALLVTSASLMGACTAASTPTPTATPTNMPTATPTPTSTPLNFPTPGPKDIVAIKIEPELPEPLFAGDTIQFKAIATHFDGSSVDVTTQVSWGSSDTDVVRINENGLATGWGEGSTVIVACLDEVCRAVTLMCSTG